MDAAKASVNERLGERNQQLMNDFDFNTALRALESDGGVVRRGKNLEIRR